MGSGRGVAGAAGVVLAAEICAPLLLLCGLCCWPDDHSDTSSNSKKGKHPQKPIISRVCSGCDGPSSSYLPRRSRASSSAVSLHLPSTSGNSKVPLTAHRSHEEIPRRRSHLTVSGDDDDGRYHSAPSVIDEVLRRRSWHRSSRDLAPAAPVTPPPCKKHHTNIKSSKARSDKEAVHSDVKDTDATEAAQGSGFYIGDVGEEKIKSVYKAKDAKQTFNESVKRESIPTNEEYERETGRAAWPRHYSRTSLLLACASPDTPPASVETVDYDGGACYLAETGTVGELRLARASGGLVEAETLRGPRARHASDGDILGPATRPESGAFSESDLELEPEGGEVPPLPPIPSIPPVPAPRRRHTPSDGLETAI